MNTLLRSLLGILIALCATRAWAPLRAVVGGGAGGVTTATCTAPLACTPSTGAVAFTWTGATITGTPAAGDMSYWTGANAEALILNSSGASGNVLTWASGAAPTWSAPTGTPGGSNTQVQFNNSSAFGGSANLTWVSPALSIGAAGTTGQLKMLGTTSGTVTITPQATAGTPTITWPNATGTVAVSASAPIALSATTGALTWTGAVIQTNGGNVVLGDILLGTSTASTYSSLASVANGGILLSTGVAAAPAWSTDILALSSALQTSKGSADAVAYALNARKARGTVASPTVITTGDDLLTINAAGYVGGTNTYRNAASIRFDSIGTISDATNGIGGEFVIGTQKQGVDTAPADSYKVDQFGHLVSLIRTANTPTMGACGTSPSIVGTDETFTVTVGTGGAATACVINFGTAYVTNPPNCSVLNNTDKVAYSTVEAVGSLTINAAAAFTASSKFKVICKGFL